jgi:hypothetical protein
VDVVGHDDEFVIEQFNVRAHVGGTKPFFIYDPADSVEARFIVDDVTEEGLSRMRDKGEEVPAFGGVVVVLQADGAAVVGRERIGHLLVLGKYQYWAGCSSAGSLRRARLTAVHYGKNPINQERLMVSSKGN